MDREKLFHDMKNMLKGFFPERKCKVYLLHGDMTDKEIHSLFEKPEIKAYLTLTHGEGFGLPIFEAAYTGIPVVAPGWSGQLDFLINKTSGKSEFYNVEYDIQPIPEDAVWDGVIIKESMWAYPREHSAKQQMRRCYADLTSDRRAQTMDNVKNHVAYLQEMFSEEKQYALMVSEICDSLNVWPEAPADDIVLEFE
jgi:glycosyltransferase involved in cell wall biosynthesis